ncbi:MAG TPA: alpha/beta fold hydrolase [Trueperaceae bacterium]
MRTEDYLDEARARPLTVEFWYPAVIPKDVAEATVYANVPWLGLEEPVSFAGRALRNAEPVGSGAPVVVYAHGAPGSRLQSTRLCEHLASHGFVVAAIDFTGMTYGDKDEMAYVKGLVDRPQDVSFVLDRLADTDGLAAAADPNNAAILGYSFGGYTALACCGAGLDFEQLAEFAKPKGEDNIGYVLGFRKALEPLRGRQLGFLGDERLRAAFVMAPWNAPALDLPRVTVPVFIAAGECDVVAPMARDARLVFERAGSDSVTMLTFLQGSHNLFTDPCLPETRRNEAAWQHCSDPIWDKERAGDILKHSALAFLRVWLSGERTAQRYLTADSVGARPGVRLERR